MCAIAGEISDTPIVRDDGTDRYLHAMLDTMRRRGPDGTDLCMTPHAALLHARLAVVDPENGRQPKSYTYAGKTYTIVYNGELYNTEDVRGTLRARCPDITFDGHGDTELLLKALVRLGFDETLRAINGIYAFALWCEESRTLWMARDPLGVKPFFFSQPSGCFLFASEMKTLLAHPRVRPVVDETGLYELFLIGPGRTPGFGVFRDIRELRPGECGILENGKPLRLRTFWRLEDRPHPEDFEETVRQVRFLVMDSIRRQLVSDVPLGTFLSGGLDSSIISAVSAQHFRERGERLQTFSVTYVDNEKYFTPSKFQPNSDEPYIDTMVAYLHSEHHRLVIGTEQLAEALLEATEARDLPGMADVDASMLLLCRAIREHVTVALSGECADEIFGGYPWFRDPEIRARYGFPWAQSTGYRATFLSPAVRGPVSPEEYVDARYRAMLADVSKQPGLSDTEDRMREMAHLNAYGFMQTLLDRKDRMSMYSGLEVRVPFCDRRIARYLYSTPWAFKDFNGREKGLLRYSMTGLLPDEILWRKKSPYPKTHNPAYTALVRRMLADIIADPGAPLLQVADRKALIGLLTDDTPAASAPSSALAATAPLAATAAPASRTSHAAPWYGQLMTLPQTIAYFIQMNHWLAHYKVQIEV